MNCPICLESFKDTAFSLVCGHLLDEACLDALKSERNDRYVVCPICRSRCPAELSAGGIRKIYLGENAPKAPNPYEYHNNEPLAADWEEYPEEPSEDLEVYDEPLYENFAEYDDEAVSGEQEDLYEAPVYEDPEEFYHDSDELDPDVLEAAYYNHEEELYRGVVGDYGDSEDELLIQIQTLSVQEYDEEF